MVKLLKSGAGKQGYCKLCSFNDPKIQDEFDKRVLDYKPKQLNDWLSTKIEGHKAVNRQTIYSHREHVRDPQDRLVNAQKKRALEHGTQPRRTSENDFLDAVISLGHQNAMNDPEAVTVDQALKATQIKKAANAKGDAAQLVIAVFSGNYSPETVIEGETKEI